MEKALDSGMAVIASLISIAILILNVFVVVYLNNLETIGCKCAMDFRRTYIMTYTIISLLNIVLYPIFRYLVVTMDSKVISIVLYAWSIIMTLAGLLNIVFAVQYIHRLREEKCACSKSVVRDVWEVTIYITIALIILAFLNLIYLLITTRDFQKSLSMLTSKVKLTKKK